MHRLLVVLFFFLSLEAGASHYCSVNLTQNSKELLYSALGKSFESVNDEYIRLAFFPGAKVKQNKKYEAQQEVLDQKVAALENLIQPGDMVQIGKESDKKINNLKYLTLQKLEGTHQHMTLCYEDQSQFKKCSDTSDNKKALQDFFDTELAGKKFKISFVRQLGRKYIVAMLNPSDIKGTDRLHISIAKVSEDKKLNKSFLKKLHKHLENKLVEFGGVTCTPSIK
jgi:hypothetical protein